MDRTCLCLPAHAAGRVKLYDNGRPVWQAIRARGKSIPSGGTLVIGREQVGVRAGKVVTQQYCIIFSMKLTMHTFDGGSCSNICAAALVLTSLRTLAGWRFLPLHRKRLGYLLF